MQLASAQDAILTRPQALAAGMSVSAIRHAIRPGGPWQRVLPGVYATFSGPLADIHRLRAAVLHGGEDALVTGDHACRMSGLSYGPEPGETVCIQVPAHVRCRSVGFVRVIRTLRPCRRTIWVGDDDLRPSQLEGWEPVDELVPNARPATIAIARAARAVVDTVTLAGLSAADVPPGWRSTDSDVLRNVRALMCEAVQRSRVIVPDLAAEVTSAPRRGGRWARFALEDVLAGCRSAPECELRDLVRRSRILPMPRFNQPLPGERGLIPDACWPSAKLVVEIDSRSFHGFGDAPARTEERRARLAALGWRVLPISPARLRRDPRGVLREIEAAYLAR